MNIREVLILVEGNDKTEAISSICLEGDKYNTVYNNGSKPYPYGKDKIVYDTCPKICPANAILIKKGENIINAVEQVYLFQDHVRIFFENGQSKIYAKSELVITESSVTNSDMNKQLTYFKEIAAKISSMSGGSINYLEEEVKRFDYLDKDSVLNTYLSGSRGKENTVNHDLIYPFSMNLSQKAAVDLAFKHSISIIEGPPGTGKTQTILNIIANAIMDKKTVAVVSGNNSATLNVLEKLNKYGLDCMAAFLGNSVNKKNFICNQTGLYPDFKEWNIGEKEAAQIKEKLECLTKELETALEKRNQIAVKEKELSDLKVEKSYFETYFKENGYYPKSITHFKNWDVDQLIELWLEFQRISEQEKMPSIWNKLFLMLQYGIVDKEIYKNSIDEIIATFQQMYYDYRIKNLETSIEELKGYLSEYQFETKLEEFTKDSMKVFQFSLGNYYGWEEKRANFKEKDLKENTRSFLQAYPLILSTTHAVRNCLQDKYLFDYIIIDEASQVDLVTGALALGCAKNAVIVGDLMQLPNVINTKQALEIKTITKEYHIEPKYDYVKKNLLASMIEVISDVPRTLLREHYRCHPKIINFCNKKFYNNELIIMTEDHNEPDTLKIFKTVIGNHDRNHYNQRQIDVIQKEVIPDMKDAIGKKIGIISPYRKQKEELQDQVIEDIMVETVHKFQGREMDDIIVTTVDNEISSFTDNPNMLNVAVSRAVNRLRVVVSASEKNENTNVGDLIKYIRYQKMEVVQSQIHSVFDMLYTSYTKQRVEYVMKHKRISKYDSENLMKGLLDDLLLEDMFTNLRVANHVRFKELIRNPDKLESRERKYVEHPMAHLDFIIFDDMDKLPVLVIEVDGYHFHKASTAQQERDEIKDIILEKYGIPIERLKTNQSEEMERIRLRLAEILRPSEISENS